MGLFSSLLQGWDFTTLSEPKMTWTKTSCFQLSSDKIDFYWKRKPAAATATQARWASQHQLLLDSQIKTVTESFSVLGTEIEHSPFICSSYLVFCLISLPTRSLQSFLLGEPYLQTSHTSFLVEIKWLLVYRILSLDQCYHDYSPMAFSRRKLDWVYIPVCDIVSKLEIWELENFKNKS